MSCVSHVTAMYATKRRRRNSKNVRTVCNKDAHAKSNPSKRHRERLNLELDTLASLLPFEQSVLSKLDKLSILRLSVSYLRTKSYFQAALAKSRLLAIAPAGSGANQHRQTAPPVANGHSNVLATQHNQLQLQNPQNLVSQAPGATQQVGFPPELRLDSDLIVQALNGFLLILTCDGEVFYTSHTVETYLGFHQSDICHQSVYELVHSEDREELMQQLRWNSMIASPMDKLQQTQAAQQQQQQQQGQANKLKGASQMSLGEILASADHRHLLERNFTVRFRCLLDNTSGFLRLDIRGRIKVLQGQQSQQNLANSATGGQMAPQTTGKRQTADCSAGQQVALKQREPLLAFFGVCIPFGPPSLLEMPSKDSVFKSKHRLDLSIISMDSRGKQLLGINDLSNYLTTAASAGSRKAAAAGGATSANVLSASPQPDGGAIKHQASVKLPVDSAATQLLPAGAGKHPISAYDLVHHDDLSYMASAHQELLKTGASGLIAYRMIIASADSSPSQPQPDGGHAPASTASPTNSDAGKYQWLQTSAKLYYKNSKPDFILCTHRPLMEEEGRDLLGKRTMDFKVTYLDSGLSSINDRIMACDKFYSLQSLAAVATAPSTPNAHKAHRVQTGSQQKRGLISPSSSTSSNTNAHHNENRSSSASSSSGSSSAGSSSCSSSGRLESLASCSPQPQMLGRGATGNQGAKRAKYATNEHHHNQLHQLPFGEHHHQSSQAVGGGGTEIGKQLTNTIGIVQSGDHFYQDLDVNQSQQLAASAKSMKPVARRQAPGATNATPRGPVGRPPKQTAAAAAAANGATRAPRAGSKAALAVAAAAAAAAVATIDQQHQQQQIAATDFNKLDQLYQSHQISCASDATQFGLHHAHQAQVHQHLEHSDHAHAHQHQASSYPAIQAAAAYAAVPHQSQYHLHHHHHNSNHQQQQHHSHHHYATQEQQQQHEQQQQQQQLHNNHHQQQQHHHQLNQQQQQQHQSHHHHHSQLAAAYGAGGSHHAHQAYPQSAAAVAAAAAAAAAAAGLYAHTTAASAATTGAYSHHAHQQVAATATPAEQQQAAAAALYHHQHQSAASYYGQIGSASAGSASGAQQQAQQPAAAAASDQEQQQQLQQHQMSIHSHSHHHHHQAAAAAAGYGSASYLPSELLHHYSQSARLAAAATWTASAAASDYSAHHQQQQHHDHWNKQLAARDADSYSVGSGEHGQQLQHYGTGSGQQQTQYGQQQQQSSSDSPSSSSQVALASGTQANYSATPAAGSLGSSEAGNGRPSSLSSAESKSNGSSRTVASSLDQQQQQQQQQMSYYLTEQQQQQQVAAVQQQSPYGTGLLEQANSNQQHQYAGGHLNQHNQHLGNNNSQLHHHQQHNHHHQQQQQLLQQQQQQLEQQQQQQAAAYFQGAAAVKQLYNGNDINGNNNHLTTPESRNLPSSGLALQEFEHRIINDCHAFQQQQSIASPKQLVHSTNEDEKELTLLDGPTNRALIPTDLDERSKIETTTDHREQQSQVAHEQNEPRDPLAQLISSTIGDIVLDVAPNNEM